MKIKPSQRQGSVVVEMDRKDPGLLAEHGAEERISPFQLKKIVVPVDFSECSRKSLQYARCFARQFGASIILVHVVQVNYGGGEFGLIDVPQLELQMREGAVRQLEEWRQSELGEDTAGETAIRTGRPTNEIVELAREVEADLIIIATHGHTGLKHVILGSVAENVIRHAPCPVLTVREHEHEFIRAEGKT